MTAKEDDCGANAVSTGPSSPNPYLQNTKKFHNFAFDFHHNPLPKKEIVV